MKALVIDDSRTMRTILARILKQLGFETAEAEHGRAGLARLREVGTVDLALVDWNMPEMNGYDFLQAVRADRAYDAMRVVMVTTEADLEHVQRALVAGANEYVMKPFTSEMLAEKLALLGIEPA
jgi:two-component system, chemotaxis family, chemotaxis protein CheY